MNSRSTLLGALALALCLAAAAPTFAQAPPAGGDLGAYLSAVNGEDRRKRISAVEAIGRMGPAARDAVPELAALLDEDDPGIRIAAVQALARMGAEARPAVPALRARMSDPNPQVARAAQIAVERIEPSVATQLRGYLSSIYFIWGASVLALGLIATFAVGRARRGRKGESKKDRPAAAPAAKAPERQPVAAADAAAAPAGADRRRVSRSLPSYDDFMAERQETVDSLKRTLGRAQEELKVVMERQTEIGQQLDRKEIAGNPDLLLKLRGENEKLSADHYWHEVRVKALEVKLLSLLMSQAATADASLRARSEAALRQKWDDLRELCAAPVKISYEREQWARRPAGERVEVDDLRAHLAEFGVSLPEDLTIPPPGEPDGPDAGEQNEPAAGEQEEASADGEDEQGSEPEVR